MSSYGLQRKAAQKSFYCTLSEAEFFVLDVTFMAEPLCLCQSRNNVGSKIGFAVKGSLRSACFLLFSTVSKNTK